MAALSTKRLTKELTDIKKNGTTPGITLLRADDLKTWFLSIEVLYPDLPNVPASTTTSTTERTPKQANTSEDEVDDEVVFISEKTKGGQETTVVDVDSVPPQKRARLVDFLGGSRRANGGGLDSAPSSPRLKQNSSGTPGSNSGTNMNDNANSKQNSGGTASRIGKTGGSPEGRMYEGQKFALKFVFEARYPIEAPQVTFVDTKIDDYHYTIPIHPHIYSNGHICASVLANEWSPVLNVSTLCITLQSMLASNKKLERPDGNDSYVAGAPKNPKLTTWDFHDDEC